MNISLKFGNEFVHDAFGGVGGERIGNRKFDNFLSNNCSFTLKPVVHTG